MRAGQKHGSSVLLMVGSTSFCREVQAAKRVQADGAVPDTSLDNLSEFETNNIGSSTALRIFKTPVTEVYIGRYIDIYIIPNFLPTCNCPVD